MMRQVFESLKLVKWLSLVTGYNPSKILTFPQSQYHFKDEIFMLSRQLSERHW